MFNNKEEFKAEFVKRLLESYGCAMEDTHPTERYMALGKMVRDYASINWVDTKLASKYHQIKQVYYFSIEFLLGRMLTSNLKNLGIYDMVTEGLKDLGIDYDELAALEKDPGLGNGGLGRLAACFIDSGASLNYALNGNTIRYKSGLFKQVINEKGEQVEIPDYWMSIGNPWEIRKPKHKVTVNFFGRVETSYDYKGDMHVKYVDTIKVDAVPYDMAIIGAGTQMTNTLRLWSAEPSDEPVNFMSRDEYLRMVENICLTLYPDDSTDSGKRLRLMQEYFFVCAGINNIISSHLKQYPNLDNLADKVAIQMNDTHPVLAVAELMRVLLDDYGYSWTKAFEITRKTLAYTNHTVMSEALEKWSASILNDLLPRLGMIIREIDRRYCIAARDAGKSPKFIEKTRVLQGDMVHMANLAIIGSHSLNGVAGIHSQILKDDLFKEFYSIYPDNFSNKTNGITPRRWMMYCNPQLKNLLDEKIGTGYHKDYTQFTKLMDYVDDPATQEAFLAVKRERKEILAKYVKETTGITVDPDSIFDSQAKRLHAYKRQLLNIMNVIYRYQRIKSDPNYRMPKHTYLFGAKAASSYTFAKEVIRLINNVARVVNSDPDVKDMIKVVFLPNYCVTMSEVLVPGTDISEQISTAGKEASGTGNMKFMMNGAVTLCTLDGANVEIDNLVGRENDVMFGLTVEDINEMKYNYNPRYYYEHDERIRRVMDSLIDNTWTNNTPNFRLIYEEILSKGDEFFVLADFGAYVEAQEKIEEIYQDRSRWARMCLVNIAQSGYFSSDRTIEEYAKDIWGIERLEF